MDRTATDPSQPGPLDRQTALGVLARADELLEGSEPGAAAAAYARVVGFPEAELTAAALYGLGTALFRLDREQEAVQHWAAVAGMPETPFSYLAWRQIAAARVREGNLVKAIEAYSEADRRAPPEDKREIASRLGWLAKETGKPGLARRYFARSRGAGATPLLTYVLLGVTIAISFAAFQPGGDVLVELLLLDKVAVAHGEYWRLFSVTLLHADPLHLLFNMYALYFAGRLVEELYGWRLFLLFWILTAAAASTASFVFADAPFAVGASGAVFGTFGVLLAVARVHNPVVDRQSRMILSQIGGLIVINLIIGFGLMGAGAPIDNAAHVGGLLAGLWLGFLLAPGRVPTLSSLWVRPTRVASATGAPSIALSRLLGVLALVTVIVVGVVFGSDLWIGRPVFDPFSGLASLWL